MLYGLWGSGQNTIYSVEFVLWLMIGEFAMAFRIFPNFPFF